MVLWTQVLGEVFKSLTELLYLLPSNLARFSCGDLRSKSEITCLCAQGDLRFDLGGTPLGAGSVQRHRDGAEWVPVGGGEGDAKKWAQCGEQQRVVLWSRAANEQMLWTFPFLLSTGWTSTPRPLELEFFIQELKCTAEVRAHTHTESILRRGLPLRGCRVLAVSLPFRFLAASITYCREADHHFPCLFMPYFGKMPKVKCIWAESTKVYGCAFT